MKQLSILTAALAVVLGTALAYGTIRGAASTGGPLSLDQDWDAATAARMHYVSQGTELMPSAWLRALRRPDGTLVMNPQNLDRLGFLDVHSRRTGANPYGWPLGLALDRIAGVETVGLNCTACHTAEYTYRGTTMRVEGGSARLDTAAYFSQLREALAYTAKTPDARKRFFSDAVAYGYPKDRLARDFDRRVSRLDLWYLYGAGVGGTSTIPGPGRVDALTAIANRLFATDIDEPRNVIRGTAPTKYPYMWDMWRLDWVQYNSSARVPMARNIGEALGVAVKTHVVDDNGKLNPEPLRWSSSVRVKALYQIEETLAKLHAPVWPSSVMGAVDPRQAARGRGLFDQYCSRCHRVMKLEGTSPTEWAVRTVPLKVIGTDPNQARMFAGARADATKLGLSASVTAADGLTYFVQNILVHAYKKAGITGALVPVYNGWGRSGHTTAPCGYKARPLVGVWATAPFLHNGSVPSIYDLLSETRPARPVLGNREFDPVKVGTVQEETPDTMMLDTTKIGNSNAGHWFTNDTSRPGRIGPALSDAQKYDLIAYLKVANYANYPTTTVKTGLPLPCDKDFEWAKGEENVLRLNAP